MKREWVRVEYPGKARVQIDEKPAGWTDSVILVPSGTHAFTVDAEEGQLRIIRTVEDTSPDRPFIVSFDLEDSAT